MSQQPPPSDDLRFAAQTAHQLKAPVTAIKMILRMLSGDFAGPLTGKQKELVGRAAGRCDQALQSISRMLAIAHSAGSSNPTEEMTDVATIIRRALLDCAVEALSRDISVASDIGTESVYVFGNEAGLHEAVCALLDNALKYTPDFGRVKVALSVEEDTQTVRISVSDSGVGIAEENRDKVFDLFFRTPKAKGSSHPGTGLGLAFVKAVVESNRGRVRVQTSALGGAEFVVELAVVEPSVVAEREEIGKSKAMKVVIVAGNKLDGQMTGISARDVYTMMQQRDDFVFLDVRNPAEYERVRLPGATLIPLGAVRGRLDELPQDKTIVAFCNISLRAYEAALILRAAGFQDVRVMDGGIEMWPYEKLT